MPKKNILLITSDELRGDCLGVMGNPDVKTPHIDALAGRGTVFERHFTPFPKCVPARCAMHTGRYCHTDGFRSVMPENHLKKGSPNLAGALRDNGYETAVLGLNHVWESDWFYGTGEQQNQKGAGAVDYTSFTKGKLDSLAMQARDYPEGTPRTGPHFKFLETVDYQGLWTGRREGFFDENNADQARCFLSELRDPDKPFFLQVNFGKPHPPYAAPEPWYSLYDPESIQPFPYDLPDGAPLPLRAQRKWRLGEDVPEAALQELQAVYYAMVSYVDDNVGKVLRALDEQGLREDTLVIFTSDHGDYAAQYGINEKWDTDLRDCLLHVPFVMAGPGAPEGKRLNGLSEHIDLPATLLDYAGLQPQEDWVWHGQSLLPMLAGAQGKAAVFADGGHEATARSRFSGTPWQEQDGRQIKATGGKQLTYAECPEAMARAKMVRTAEWKLIVRETGEDELYNVAEDPHEMRNRIGDPACSMIVSDLQRQLLNWCLGTDTDQPRLESVRA